MFGRDAIFRGLRNPDPAAHGDAIHDGGDGLWISEEQMVEAIFGVEEGPRFLAVLRAAFREHADVPPRPQAADLPMVDDDRPRRSVIPPPQHPTAHRYAHPAVERVDHLGT